MHPERIVLIDIDGLRPDVFHAALEAEEIPNLARLVGGGLHIEIAAPAPSITFCSQACLFTGAHPDEHGVPGNQFFDRFGSGFAGAPRHYAFDIGDSLAVDDAVLVFTHSLAGNRLGRSTIYDRFTEKGKTSVVAGNMYARGATTWIKPNLANIARFTRGGNRFGMSSRTYDQDIVDRLVARIRMDGLPDLTTLYLMGLDHDSHAYGPIPAQRDYLVDHVDAMVGEFWEAVVEAGGPPPLVAVFSDHGQIRVIPDDAHSLRIGFPFDKEVVHFFTALGLDVHDYPGEDPHCDAVMATNGGLAFVYLRSRVGEWSDPPEFQRDVLPVARAFWEAHATGVYAAELQGALAGVLLRDVGTLGWETDFKALTPDGAVVPLDAWFAAQPEGLYLDPVNRLRHQAGRFAGDLLLISNYAEGYYFGSETVGIHGGLHPEDSLATLSYGWPGASGEDWGRVSSEILSAIEARCAQEGGRMAMTCDLVVGIEAACEVE
ncbi:MAG TPA: alkaline phosphatase family protein [Anaerolineales bacterium]|nr:alkaline phosphatase family protein [Anaerolineales bacterium]